MKRQEYILVIVSGCQAFVLDERLKGLLFSEVQEKGVGHLSVTLCKDQLDNNKGIFSISVLVTSVDFI